jgi:tetratricopeptide (TPR) repeat protein
LLGASDPVDVDATNLVLQPDHGKLLCLNNKPPAVKAISKKLTIVTSSNNPTSTKPIISNPKAAVLAQVNNSTDLTQLVKQRQWSQVLKLIDTFSKKKSLTADVLTTKAEALANLGHLKEAAECCVLSLQIDSIRLATYFTYAMILNGLEDTKSAEEALRKTLFLDRDFVLGHYQLGLMLIRNKDLAGGLKSLKNAYAITQQNNPAQSVPGYEDLTFGKLTDILHEEIQVHEIGSDAHETE